MTMGKIGLYCQRDAGLARSTSVTLALHGRITNPFLSGLNTSCKTFFKFWFTFNHKGSIIPSKALFKINYHFRVGAAGNGFTLAGLFVGIVFDFNRN